MPAQQSALLYSKQAGEPTPIHSLPWKKLLGIFVLSRVLIFLGILLAQSREAALAAKTLYRFLFNAPDPSGSPFAYHPFYYQLPLNSPEAFAQSWDGWWYLKIAMDGYDYDGTTLHQTVAHYPFFSWLVQGLSLLPQALGVPEAAALMWTGLILNNLLFGLSIIFLYKLVNKYSGYRVAMLAAILLALYPGSLSCSLFLAESLFLVLSLGYFLALESERPWVAALLCWPANLTRLNGGLLLLPFFQHYHLWRLPNIRWVPFLVMLASMAAFPLFLYLKFGDPWIYFRLQGVYRGSVPIFKLVTFAIPFLFLLYCPLKPERQAQLKPTSPGVQVLRRLILLGSVALLLVVLLTSGLNLIIDSPALASFQRIIPFHETLGMIATLGGFILFAAFHNNIPREYRAYTALSLFALLFSGTFLSNHRYMVLVFPVFWCLAIALKDRPVLQKATSISFGTLLVLLTTLYTAYNWIFLF